MNETAPDIGARLRHARQARGLTLRDIADSTKISPVALTAIERNDFGRLPGGLFARAYVRSFAEHVGLDADAITREYRDRFEAAGPEEPVLQQRALRESRARALRRLAGLAAAAAFVILALIASAFYLSRTGASPVG
jgi:cytoskeleton protein RodZ